MSVPAALVLTLFAATLAPAAAPRARCGMSVAHSWEGGGYNGYGSAASAASLDELKELGIRAVSITPFGWMESTTSAEVHWAPGHQQGESFARLRAIAKQARARNMGVLLKPHIWIRGGAWRGEIDPSAATVGPNAAPGGWEKWLADYRDFAVAYARLAEEISADWYCFGVELVNPVRQRPRAFAAIIEAVRRVYSGKLTYCANWDRVEAIPFWAQLDAVGVQMFAPLLRAGEAPTAARLRAGAEDWLQRFSRVAIKADKPLLLTEVGYMNREGAAQSPWLWPERLRVQRTDAGDREQAAAYTAILETFGGSSKVAGLYFWKWFSYVQTREEGAVGFSPRLKPAAKVLAARCK